MSKRGRWGGAWAAGMLAAAMAMTGWAPAARAEDTTVAVLDLTFEGEIPSWMSARLRQRLDRGLAATGLTMMPAARVSAALEGSGGSCATDTCRRALGVRLGCDYLVGGTISGQARSYRFRLWIARASSGELAATLEEGCDICGQRKVFSRMELVASRLSAKMAEETRAPARVILISRPDGASITLDGKPAGTTPRTLTLGPGKHRVTVEAPGFIAAALELTARSGMEERREVELIPVGQKPARGSVLGWVAAGAGVAALAAGVALLALDGHEAGCSGDEISVGTTRQPCPEVYSTAAAGGVLTGVGAAALVGAGVLLYLGYSDSGEQTGVRLTATGIQGRFW